MKKLLIGLVALVVLLLVGVGIVLLNLNPIIERLKPTITSTVSQAIGQPVTLDDIKVSLWPRAALKVKGLSLAKGQLENASLDSLELATSFGDLLRGKFRVSELTLVNPSIVIAREKDGSLTIGGIHPKTKSNKTSNQKAPTELKPTEQKPTDDSNNSLELNIEIVQIRKGNIVFIDRAVSPEQKIRIEDILVEITDLSPKTGGIFHLTASILGTESQNLQLSGNIKLRNGFDLTNATAHITTSLRSVDLNKLTSLAKAYGINVSGLKLADSASTDLKISLDNSKMHVETHLNANNASVSFGNIFNKPAGRVLSIEAKADSILNPSVPVPTTIQLSHNNLTLGTTVISAPLNFKTDAPIEINVKTSNTSLSNLAQFITPMQTFSLSGNISTDMLVSVGKKQPSLNASGFIDIKDVSLRVPTPTPIQTNGQTDGQKNEGILIESISGHISLDAETITTKNMTLAVEKQPLEVRIKTRGAPIPKSAAYVVTSSKLNLGSILRKAAPTLKGFENSYLSDLQLKGTYALGTTSGNAVLTAATSSIKDINITNISINSSFSPKAIKLRPSTIELFEGKITAKGTHELTQGLFAFDVSGSGINMEEVSSYALTSSPVTVSGTVSTLSTKPSGNIATMPDSLEGPTSIVILDGAIDGINIIALALKGINKIPGIDGSLAECVPEEHQATLQANNTPFSSFNAALNFGNGQITLENVSLEHPLYILTGKGKTGFDGTMHIRAKLKLTALLAEGMTLKQPKLKLLLDRNNNLVVPIIIRKKDGPSLVLPDTKDLIKRAMKNTAKEAIGRELNKITPGLGNAKQIIDSLF